MINRLIIFLFLTGLFFVSCGQKDKPVKFTYGEEVIISYYPDSTKRIVIKYANEDTTYALKTYYYKSGEKFMEGELHHGKRNKQWKAWNKNGQVIAEGNYTDGIENGLKTVYFDNGNKRYEGHYEDNKRVGEWTFWFEDGRIAKKINYDIKE